MFAPSSHLFLVWSNSVFQSKAQWLDLTGRQHLGVFVSFRTVFFWKIKVWHDVDSSRQRSRSSLTIPTVRVVWKQTFLFMQISSGSSTVHSNISSNAATMWRQLAGSHFYPPDTTGESCHYSAPSWSEQTRLTHTCNISFIVTPPLALSCVSCAELCSCVWAVVLRCCFIEA